MQLAQDIFLQLLMFVGVNKRYTCACRKMIDADFRSGQREFVVKFCSCIWCYTDFVITCHMMIEATKG